MNPTRLPIAVELFAQWQRARGGRIEPNSRPFSRNWENLLEDAHLVSVIERSDAEHDAKLLATDGWVDLKPVRYKAHLIERIVIPLAAEARWREMFGFVPPSDEEARQIREFSWQREMEFVREAKLNLSFVELRQLNDFFKHPFRDRDIIPIKERSLQIFADEKRLDTLLTSALFREDRLNLVKHLRCEIIGVPLAWKRGPAGASAKPIIVIENAATWHSYCRWNAEQKLFSAVVYGSGNCFLDGVRYLGDIFEELGGSRTILYFGDLDSHGLRIPQLASKESLRFGFRSVEPHLWSYRQLLRLAESGSQPCDFEQPATSLCDWLVDCAEPARQLFARSHRLAQENIGWEFLRLCDRENL